MCTHPQHVPVNTATHTGPQNMQQDTFPSRTIDPKSRVSQPTSMYQQTINRYPQHPLAFSWQCHQPTIESSAARCMRPQQLQIVRLEAMKLRTPFTHNLVARSKLEYGLLSQPIFCSSHRKSCYQEGVQVS